MQNSFKKFLIDFKFILISFGMSVAVMILIMFCYDMVPFGDITILRMDLYHQYGPLLAELYDRLTSGGSLVYSWQSGGGGSFLGNFFNYLSSPISFFVLLFGHKNTTDAILFVIGMKAALSAGTLNYYFKESPEFKINNFITSGFGVLYAFSGYFVAYYWDFMWLDGMVLLPLIILGLEKLIDGEKPYLYAVSLAILMFSSYYMAYMVCIFSVLYAISYYAGKQSFGKKLFIAIGKFIGGSLLAAGLAAFALIPTYYCLKTCSATSGSFPSELTTYFNIFDFLANHLAGLDPTIRSSGDDVLPNVYCGIATIILAILYLYIREIPLKEKISRVVLLIVLFLSFDLNMLNFIWHGFHFPNDLPYRWSYCYSFILLTLAVKAISKIEKVSGRDLLTVGVGLSIFIIVLEEIGSKNVKTETIIISLVFTIIYVIILEIMRSKRAIAGAMSVIMFCLFFSEIAIANTENYDIDQPKENYASDYEEFSELKAKIDADAGTDMYRMELTALRTRMDPCWYNYNGLSTFSSMAYEKSANLQSNLGMFSNYINSYTYNQQTMVYNAMFSLSYLVNNSYAIDINENFYDEIASSENFTAYKNNYALPLGYVVSRNITAWDTTYSNPFDVQSEYWQLTTGLMGVFDRVPVTSVTYNNIDDFGDDIDVDSFTFSRIDSDEPASFTLVYTPEKTENLYIYLSSSSVQTIIMRNEDCSFYKSQTVDEPYIFDLGEHAAGEELYIEVEIDEGSMGYVDAYVVGLNEDVFKAGYEILSDEGLEISEWSDTEISGTVTAKEDGILYTSINYDSSWEVYVDGEKLEDVEIYALGGALLGFDIDEGTHEITLQYKAQGLTLGIIISIVSLALLITLIVIDKKKPRKSEAS